MKTKLGFLFCVWGFVAEAAQPHSRFKSLERCYVSIRHESLLAKADVKDVHQELMLSFCLELFPERKKDYPKARQWNSFLNADLEGAKQNLKTSEPLLRSGREADVLDLRPETLYQVLRWAEPQDLELAPDFVVQTVDWWKKQLRTQLSFNRDPNRDPTGTPTLAEKHSETDLALGDVLLLRELKSVLNQPTPHFTWGRRQGLRIQHSAVFGIGDLHLSFYWVPSFRQFKATLVHELAHVNTKASSMREASKLRSLDFDELVDLAVIEEVQAHVFETMVLVKLDSSQWPELREIEDAVLSSFREEFSKLLSLLEEQPSIITNHSRLRSIGSFSDPEILDLISTHWPRSR